MAMMGGNNTMEIKAVKISPALEWMRHYLKNVDKRLLPVYIRSFKPPNGYKLYMRGGSCYIFSRKVIISTHIDMIVGKPRIQARDKFRMLRTLAHELAHFRFKGHHQEHSTLTEDIYSGMVGYLYDGRIQI